MMYSLLVVTLLILLISLTNGYSIRSSSSINRIVKKNSVIRTSIHCSTTNDNNDVILDNNDSNSNNNSNNDNTVTTTSTTSNTSTTTTTTITNDENDKKKGFIDPEVYNFYYYHLS